MPFDLPALKAIFSGPVYSEGTRPVCGAGDAAYWLPLLGLFTGARLEELGQLRPEDVYEETYFNDSDAEQCAWVLRISGYGAGQQVKNEGSNRRFPIHPELVRLGFLKYVAQAAGRARLFDKLKPDPYGTETGTC